MKKQQSQSFYAATTCPKPPELPSFLFPLFLLRYIERGVIGLKENCGLYLHGDYQRAVCICYIMRDVFVPLFSRGALGATRLFRESDETSAMVRIEGTGAWPDKPAMAPS